MYLANSFSALIPLHDEQFILVNVSSDKSFNRTTLVGAITRRVQAFVAINPVSTLKNNVTVFVLLFADAALDIFT